jgi:hypothetical protein
MRMHGESAGCTSCVYVVMQSKWVSCCRCRPLLGHVLVAWRLQDNGKPIFFSRNADVPLAFDHLRYYAG